MLYVVDLSIDSIAEQFAMGHRYNQDIHTFLKLLKVLNKFYI